MKAFAYQEILFREMYLCIEVHELHSTIFLPEATQTHLPPWLACAIALGWSFSVRRSRGDRDRLTRGCDCKSA